tara:strand:- start:23 stop:217 length:195 start_codon:yes stop_codon:yes gene_type:complete
VLAFKPTYLSDQFSKKSTSDHAGTPTENSFSNGAFFYGTDIAQDSSHEVKQASDFGYRHNFCIP